MGFDLTPDPSFGDDGVVVSPDSVVSLLVDSNGEITSSDFHEVWNSTGQVVAELSEYVRYRSDGSIAWRFDEPNFEGFPFRIAADGDGGVIVMPLGTGSLERIRPDGSLDPDFGLGGRVELPRTATGILRTPERIEVLTGTSDPTNPQIQIIGLRLDGTVDDTFGSAGSVSWPLFPPIFDGVICRGEVDWAGIDRARAVLMVDEFCEDPNSFGYQSDYYPATEVDPDGALSSPPSALHLAEYFRLEPQQDGSTIWSYGNSIGRILPDGTADPALGPAGLAAPEGERFVTGFVSSGGLVVFGNGVHRVPD